MAKLFNQLYTESIEKIYSQAKFALVLLAKMNNAADFSAVLAPNGKVDGTTTKWNVQRRKRPAVNTVANVNTGTTTAALTALDQFSKIDWETVEVATGALRSVGFKETLAADYDYSNSPAHAKDMEYIVGEIAIQRHKDLLTLYETFTETAAALPAYAANTLAVSDAIVAERNKLVQVSDDFKDITNQEDYVIITSLTVATELKKELGTVFNQEAPIAQTGFKTNMSIEGTPVIVDPRLTGRTTYILHNQTVGFKSNQAIKDVKLDLGLAAFTGRFFWDVLAVIDAKRAVKFKAPANP